MLPPSLVSLMDGIVKAFVELVRVDGEGVQFPELLTVEERLSEFTQETGRRMLQAFTDTRLEQTQATRQLCSRCQQAMEWHKKTDWPHGSRLGEIRVKDVYAYCRTCSESDRPLHKMLGTGPQRWSLPVQQDVVDLASDESCEKAVAKLARMHPGVEVGRTTALRMLHHHGAAAQEFVKEKLQAALASAEQEGHPRGGVVELEVEYDGGMVPVATLEDIHIEDGQEPERTPVRGLPKRHKNCRWEEAKVGLVQVPGEVNRLYTARPTSEIDAVFQDLLALSCLKGWTEQTQVRGIADGAQYIRVRLAETFHACPFQFILDRPHAKEHLSDAGEALEPLTGEAKSEWAAGALKKLEAGQALEVVAELRAFHEQSDVDLLRREANYFERNQDAVAYAQYRERGWSSASSEVESSHRSVVQVRLKLPGTWWHPDNVGNILALRIIKANGWWGEYWSAQRQAWRTHAQQLRTEPRRKAA